MAFLESFSLRCYFLRQRKMAASHGRFSCLVVKVPNLFFCFPQASRSPRATNALAISGIPPPSADAWTRSFFLARQPSADDGCRIQAQGRPDLIRHSPRPPADIVARAMQLPPGVGAAAHRAGRMGF